MGSFVHNIVVDGTGNITTPFRVLVIGGSYGGLSAALNLQDLCQSRAPRCGPGPVEGQQLDKPREIAVEITIVDERDGFYHLIGSPLALASESYAEKAWVKFEDIPALRSPNIRTVHGSVQYVDTESKIATVVANGGDPTTSQIQYDYLVASAGLRRVWPVVPQSLRRKQYLFEASEHIRASANARHGVAVVGGGAVGIEMAAELKLVQPQLTVTLVHSRSQLLSSEPLPAEAKDASLVLVREAGVDVLLSHRLDRTEEETSDNGSDKCLRLHFTNGHTMLADQVIMAISRPIPSSSFLPAQALDKDGYVRIRPDLAFPADVANGDDHFAIGDMVSWSGIKRCGGAMHMGYFAANNVYRRMVQRIGRGGEGDVKELKEIPPMIGLAVGKKAMSYWPQTGVAMGEDVMEAFFGNDLGFTICWNHLQLGESRVVA
ncbi:pyridine nucleotide-disulfide oxidoreductase-like protein [Bombardia bombarda]|uniref:Pyridine nucleotide-disulfide oxidoreductase-like protein n=1 Tax=Bombardia bombarda TaxID=252184 RepID=A0AA39W437_9PEZI|nr:pyridine nucleotide-disulfide oxidoreductase-like protein [Bombardia bombarda]